jgi:hypothetical protein
MRTNLLIIISIICLSINGCSSCDGENPSVLLINNGTGKADIQIKTSGGNTENINNIEPGDLSERRTFAPGEIEFTVSIQGVADPVVYVLFSSSCYDYDVKINSDNTVTSAGSERD